MKKIVLAFLIVASVSMVQAHGPSHKKISIPAALTVLEKTNPDIIQQLQQETPVIIPALRHKHQSFGSRIGGFAGRTLLSIVALALFAIINDQFTARASKEYFSEGFHKNNMDSFAPGLRSWLAQKDSPTLWGIAWGIIAGGIDMALFNLAAPLLSTAMLLSNAPPMPLKKMIGLMLAAAAVTGSATAYAYHHADQVMDIGGVFTDKDQEYRDMNAENRAQVLERFARYRGVSDDARKAMGVEGREQYYRVAAAHKALYGVGVPSIVVMLAVIIAWRIHLQKTFVRQKPFAQDILAEVQVTDENREALAALQAVLN